MVKGGLAAPWAIAMSLLVYAGSAQLAALPLIATGMPLWVIVATGLITNLRFVIYSAALRPYFAHEPSRKRAALGFFMTDFTFTLFMRARAGRHACPNAIATPGSRACAPPTGSRGRSARSPASSPRATCPRDWGLEFTGTLALVALVGPALIARPAIVGRGGRRRGCAAGARHAVSTRACSAPPSPASPRRRSPTAGAVPRNSRATPRARHERAGQRHRARRRHRGPGAVDLPDAHFVPAGRRAAATRSPRRSGAALRAGVHARRPSSCPTC